MATINEVLAAGIPAYAARRLGQGIAATALTATGSAQADAYPLTSSFSEFGTVDSSTGALLPTATGKTTYVIYNGGSNALTVYPTGSETVNGTTSFSVTNAKSAMFTPAGNTWTATLGA